MATLFEVNQIEITLNEGILSIRQEYKSPITIPLMYVPIFLQLIEKECYPDKNALSAPKESNAAFSKYWKGKMDSQKENEASDGQS